MGLILSVHFVQPLNITKSRFYIPRCVQDSSDLHNVFAQAIKNDMMTDREAAQAGKQVSSVPSHERLLGQLLESCFETFQKAVCRLKVTL